MAAQSLQKFRTNNSQTRIKKGLNKYLSLLLDFSHKKIQGKMESLPSVVSLPVSDPTKLQCIFPTNA